MNRNITTVKVDHVGFNATHWATKSEDDFIKDGVATGNHPKGLTDDKKKEWLKSAYQKCKDAMAPKKEVPKPAAATA